MALITGVDLARRRLGLIHTEEITSADKGRPTQTPLMPTSNRPLQSNDIATNSDKWVTQ
jgi:hypothetical protein